MRWLSRNNIDLLDRPAQSTDLRLRSRDLGWEIEYYKDCLLDCISILVRICVYMYVCMYICVHEYLYVCKPPTK